MESAYKLKDGWRSSIISDLFCFSFFRCVSFFFGGGGGISNRYSGVCFLIRITANAIYCHDANIQQISPYHADAIVRAEVVAWAENKNSGAYGIASVPLEE